MKRRSFLRMLGLAPVAAAVPAVAAAETFRMSTRASTPGKACTVSMRVDTSELRAELTKISEEACKQYTREIFAATARPLRGME